jgi:hypothetical protein
MKSHGRAREGLGGDSLAALRKLRYQGRATMFYGHDPAR